MHIYMHQLDVSPRKCWEIHSAMQSTTTWWSLLDTFVLYSLQDNRSNRRDFLVHIFESRQVIFFLLFAHLFAFPYRSLCWSNRGDDDQVTEQFNRFMYFSSSLAHVTHHRQSAWSFVLDKKNINVHILNEFHTSLNMNAEDGEHE